MFSIFCLIFLFVPINTELSIDIKDAKLSVPQLLEKYGYPNEEHTVTTKDGYFIVLHRILSRKTSNEPTKVIYLNHGLMAATFNWVLNGPNNSLGYLLADAGYDVWMVNNRGNGYSMNRSITTDKNYWSFDMNEMGIYDTPASIDYILNITGQTDLTFIGHSQGCTLFFIMCSQKPEYESKINKLIALAPLLSMKYANLVLKTSKDIIEADMLHMLDRIGAFDLSAYMKTFTSLCSYVAIDRICKLVYTLFQGWTPSSMPLEFFTVLFGHYPGGASSKNGLQVLRWIGKEDIGKYDYGPLLNAHYYMQAEPPTYDLGSVNVPKYIFYGGKDNVILKSAVEYGLTKIRNVKNVTKIGKFSHNDFVHGLHVKKYINKKILKILMDKY